MPRPGRRLQSQRGPPSEQTGLDVSSNLASLRADNETLNALVHHLQQEKLSALDDFQPQSDADLEGEMTELQYQIMNYSRSLRSSQANSKETKSALGDTNTLTRPNSQIRSNYFFESILWKQLILQLFEHPFKAFGGKGEMINETWCLIFDTGKSQSSQKIRRH